LAFYVDYIRDNYPLKVLLLLVFLFFIYRSEKETLLRILRRK